MHKFLYTEYIWKHNGIIKKDNYPFIQAVSFEHFFRCAMVVYKEFEGLLLACKNCVRWQREGTT